MSALGFFGVLIGVIAVVALPVVLSELPAWFAQRRQGLAHARGYRDCNAGLPFDPPERKDALDAYRAGWDACKRDGRAG